MSLRVGEDVQRMLANLRYVCAERSAGIAGWPAMTIESLQIKDVESILCVCYRLKRSADMSKQ